ncbi:MAG: glycosyltransferase [Balneola sp.]
MNILFVIPRFPNPPLKGDQLIVYNRLKGLGANFKITLLLFYENDKDLKQIDDLHSLCEEIIPVKLTKLQSWINVAKAFFSNELPFQVNYYSSRAFENELQKLILKKKFDLVHVFTLRLAEFTKPLRIPVVYELIDSMQLNVENMVREEKFFKKWIYKKEQKRINKYEKELCRDQKYLCVVSEKDKQRINEPHIHVIPNGVDTEKFSKKGMYKNGEIIFTGNMGYLPNVHAVKWFAKKCFPIVKQAIPHATFHIVGANPTSYVKSMDDGHSIFVTGFVDSMVDELNKAQIAVAPMRSGSGMQNKIIEAMSCEVPVVTTHNGLEGLFAIPDEEILVADTPNTYAQAVIDLLSDQKLSDTIAINSRKYVQKYHSWTMSNGKISDLYIEVLADKLREKKTLIS